MKNEIRLAVPLPSALEDETFDLQGQALELAEQGKMNEALEKIWMAWNMLPEPKFNTSCSDTILCDLIEILNAASQHHNAENMLQQWISDIENSGYKIYITTSFILAGETFLYLNEAEKAKDQFYKAVKHGANKRDFSSKPGLYYDIAKKRITENTEIMGRFQKELLQNPDKNPKQEELSDEISDQIEDLSEQGSELFDEENYSGAIECWTHALALLPKPQNIYSESLWLETSIGDAYFQLADFEQAIAHFINAKGNNEENGYDNAFIMLRLGQLYFEREQFDQAKEFLLRSYMLEGEEIFEEDKKYFSFLKENVKLE